MDYFIQRLDHWSLNIPADVLHGYEWTQTYVGQINFTFLEAEEVLSEFVSDTRNLLIPYFFDKRGGPPVGGVSTYKSLSGLFGSALSGVNDEVGEMSSKRGYI